MLLAGLKHVIRAISSLEDPKRPKVEQIVAHAYHLFDLALTRCPILLIVIGCV